MTPRLKPAPARPTILDVMRDPRLCGPSFPGATWRPWQAALAAIFGLPVPASERALVETCTGRADLHGGGAPMAEAWLAVGRRGGKSEVAALIAVYLACFRQHRLAPGERGVLQVIAADRRQARVVFRYIKAMLSGSDVLRGLVTRETANMIDLSNRISIEIHTASFRSVRGYTCIGVVADEIAFWQTGDSANPDAEILNALRPAMATQADALLVAISSPYARRGELWKAHARHFGRAGSRVLVWRSSTWTMNPTLSRESPVIVRAYEEDPDVAAAEYGAEFRRDVERPIAREVIDAATPGGLVERPPIAGVMYRAFVDPSGGSADSMTLAIAHHEDGRAVVDAVREQRPPFSPEATVEAFCTLLAAYGVREVVGDRYGGEWPRERFQTHGVSYVVSEATKNDLYRDLVPALNSGRVALLDVPRLLAQLEALERRPSRTGRDLYDHAPGGHDDVANAVAGAVALVTEGPAACAGVMVPPRPDAPTARDRHARFHTSIFSRHLLTDEDTVQ